MIKRNIHVLCITETHVQECQEYICDNGFLVILSGDDTEAPSHTGVGFIIAPCMKPSLIGSTLFSNRIAAIKLKCKHGRIAITCAYAPHNGHPVRNRSRFFSQLSQFHASISVNGPKFLFGDLNSRIHVRRAGEHEIIGPYVFGDPAAVCSITKNRSFLLEMCSSLQLCIANTFFNHAIENQVTYWGIGATRSYTNDSYFSPCFCPT